MPKAKLSQIASTWMDEEDGLKRKRTNQEKDVREEEQPKKKQTFNLKVDTIKRLWMQRVRTDKPVSEIMDELVLSHLPAVKLDKKRKE